MMCTVSSVNIIARDILKQHNLLTSPVARLHLPRFEHSALLCAISVAVAMSLQAAPDGQVRLEQSAPVNPAKHSQTPQGVVHSPFPEQEFGQGVYVADED